MTESHLRALRDHLAETAKWADGDELHETVDGRFWRLVASGDLYEVTITNPAVMALRAKPQLCRWCSS